MTKGVQRLIREYHAVEKRFRVIDCCDKYSRLVTADGNQGYPVQRWFHLKEAFSLSLLPTLLADWKIPPESVHRVLDPFCGVGTTLLAVQRLAKAQNRKDIEAVGLERNPFLHFAAKTKAEWHHYDPSKLRTRAMCLLNGGIKSAGGGVPPLSTLRRRDVFDPRVLRRALGVREAMDALPPKERAPLLLGYASILEGISGARKDGRALRIEPTKRRSRLAAALGAAWERIADDLAVARECYQRTATKAYLGDGRTLKVDRRRNMDLGRFDLIIYSPPYLNNIDYTEVYKIELWMCGFIRTLDQFRGLRYETFRSHPSVRFPDAISIAEDKRMTDCLGTLEALIDALPGDKHLAWRSALFRGYFDDIYLSLLNQAGALATGGRVFCVVGNSLHGSSRHPGARVPVASDLLIAQIAQALGLEVEAIQVARKLRRRGPCGDFLRESILVMRGGGT